ncbi:putative competence-damage inducible protein [Pseudodesulfovibrio hydrargyri]|uniref:Molybdopterin molybdenumtransferase n=1 Tax=Pseudodesulfovibrio hydrargyri TaxID=2125990 RepID=A0A1J5NCF2_9BACT|nr:molybdopterin-binding protein [Pseudodesulfovibrio hydrargyri]OIQ50903.1 putative competence-damage inducible protein [Pseudodesulfovibrio hydrargyri]
MKRIAVDEMIGTVLAHDLTRVVAGESKGVAFKRGHVIEARDLPMLKDMGRNHLYALDVPGTSLHENDGALRLAESLAGDNVGLSGAREGRVDLMSGCTGLLDVNRSLLDFVNAHPEIVVATRHTDSVVRKGDTLAGAKIVPLTVEKSLLAEIEMASGITGPLLRVRPFLPLRVGMVVTGSEVYHGRIKDTFSPVLEKKVAAYGGRIVKKALAPDDTDALRHRVADVLREEIDLLVLTGGMSVDPDDLTPGVIASIATDIVAYGSPVLPGAMFMAAYRGELPIIGVPACGMYNKTTVLDLVLPRLFAGQRISREFLLSKAHGGLCLNCPDCTYPDCPFGK